jgi:hypothetical protein
LYDDIVSAVPKCGDGGRVGGQIMPRVQLLLGYTIVDSTVRYLGVELDDALSIAEQIDI